MQDHAPGTNFAKPLAPTLSARGLTFQPQGPMEATPLRDVTFHVPARSLLLVAGSTGAGKSTLLRLIAGLGGCHPDPRVGGRLEVLFPDDPPPEGPLPGPRPGRVVLVPQSPRDGLVDLDVLGALALPLEQQGLPPGVVLSRLEGALDQMGILGLAAREVGSLSTGEARRVALASAFAQDAGLVLLDEPMADLDPLGVKALQRDLQRLTQDRTVVVAEHRHHLVKGADQSLHLVRSPAQDLPPSPLMVPPAPPGPPRIEMAGVRLVRGDRVLLDDAGFSLGPGVWGLLGGNGVGKTSLLMVIAGILAPGAGEVEVGGVPVWRGGRRVRPRRRHEMRLRRMVQVAFQEPREAFFASTVMAELSAPLVARGMPRERADAQAQGGLEAVGRPELAKRSPVRLSGGEARLVQLLGAGLGSPGVWLLDEPTHGLDSVNRRRLRDLLVALRDAGHLVVVATHEPGILPEKTQWLFLPGDARVLSGQEAAPGQREPMRAGFTSASLQEDASGSSTCLEVVA
jgi:energy-coupling factor transport system ATP-binding protein